MASSKVLLYKCKKKKDGSHPLVLRITKDRKIKYVFLGPHLHLDEWDETKLEVKKSHPNSARINNLILKKRTETDDLLLEASANNKEITASQIRKTIKRSGKSVSFFALADERYKDYIKLGKHGVAESDKSRVNNLKAFMNGEELLFPEITKSFLERFEIYLRTPKETAKKKKKPNGTRSVMNHLLLIRTIFNDAIEDGIVDRKYYPFGKGKITVKFPESIKIGLEEKEVKSMHDLKLEEGSPVFDARNKWLYSFYFAGMRISDVLMSRWTDHVEDRLLYRMGKNQKVVSVKVPEKVKPILAYYEKQKRSDDDFIFPDMKTANLNDTRDVYRKLNTATKNTGDHLKTIAKMIKTKKKVNPHGARHTFGNISGEKISPQMLQKLYRHSDIRTTMGYQANFIHKNADEALEAVIGF